MGNETIGKFFLIQAYIKTYFVIILFPFIILLPDIIYILIKRIFYPSSGEILKKNLLYYIKEIV